MERWDKALASYEAGREYFEAQGNELFLAHCYLGKGDCLRRLKDPEAILALERTREVYRKLNAPLYDARVDWNLGGYYDAIGDHSAALSHYQRALDVFRKHENATEQALVSLDIAKVYLTRKFYDQARAVCIAAIPVLERQGMAELREAMDYLEKAMAKNTKGPVDVLVEAVEKVHGFIRDASTNPALKFSMT